MRCHICDRGLAEGEISQSKIDRGGFLPCGVCKEASEGLFKEPEEEGEGSDLFDFIEE